MAQVPDCPGPKDLNLTTMSKRKADGVSTSDAEVPASRIAQFNQDVRALNMQFASWVDRSKSAHASQLWDAGIRY